MITEDYVSFETAKLLKEKGFDEECHSHYYPCHYSDGSIEYHKYQKTCIKKNKSWYDIYSLKNLPKDHYLAPTLQMAMKWLREKYNLNVEVCLNAQGYEGIITTLFNGDIKITNVIPASKHSIYEEACEAAIKYCLKNLI